MMKQQITLKQWNQLNEKEKDILYRFFMGDIKRYDDSIDGALTIGQLIEYLGDKWMFIIGYHSSFGDTAFRTNNICDALWESTKYKLRN